MKISVIASLLAACIPLGGLALLWAFKPQRGQDEVQQVVFVDPPDNVEVLGYFMFQRIEDPNTRVQWPICISADKNASVIRMGAFRHRPDRLWEEHALLYYEALLRELNSWIQREQVKVLSVAVEETHKNPNSRRDTRIPLTLIVTVDRGKP